MRVYMYVDTRMYLYVHVRARVCVRVFCVVGASVGSEAVKSCKSHGHTRCSQVESCERAGVSARDSQWRVRGRGWRGQGG